MGDIRRCDTRDSLIFLRDHILSRRSLSLSGQFLWVLMEVCNHGELTSHIAEPIDPTLRDHWIDQMALGIKHMHHLNVIHLDIKTVRKIVQLFSFPRL